MQEAPPHPTQGRTETQRATRWGAACVPQLSHIRPESARQFIQNCFTKSQSEQNQRRSLPETGESLRLEAHGDGAQECATLDSHVHNRLLRWYDTTNRRLLPECLLRQRLAFSSAYKGRPLRKVSTTQGTMSVCCPPLSLERRITTKRKNSFPTIF